MSGVVRRQKAEGRRQKLKLLEEIQQYLRQFFKKNATFIIAVSGGVDSMALLHCLSQISKYHYIVVSIDHSIRQDSKDDIALVKKAAQKYKIPFHSKKVTVPTLAKQQRKGLEEAARDIRYQVLQKYQKKYQAAAIITAHHQDDQLETILFHLIRGSDIQGLVGMEMLNKQQIFRPLLTTAKKDIIAYAQKHQLQWREDSTNRDTTLSRNFIRHNLLPHFPRELIIQLSNQAKTGIATFDQFIENWLRDHLNKDDDQLYFKRQDFFALPIYLQFYLLQHITKHYFRLRDLSFSWLSSVYQWITQSKSSSRYRYRNKLLLKHKLSKIYLVKD
ncbi:MAG: tRNA lysidine(34) synthetase TilS [Candidatus Abawacabacteria bacterium]|nr:tRNA lysidine(34) synthetase TilS [Candidatus Abawacabacteria bacterium]